MARSVAGHDGILGVGMTVSVTELRPGDVIEIPGWMLHEELSGLTFEVRVGRIEPTADGWIDVYHADKLDEQPPTKTWFRPDELVKVLRRAA